MFILLYSYCPEHQWTTTLYEPGRKSIFASQHQQDDEELDEGAGDTEDDLVESDEELTTGGGRLQEELNKNQMGDCKMIGRDSRQKATKENLEEKGGSGESDERTRFQGGQGKDGETRCWKHIEKSPVRNTETSEFEEKCWKGIESSCTQNMEPCMSTIGHEASLIGRSKGHSERELISENPQVKEVVEDMLNSIGIQNQDNTRDKCRVNVGNHHDGKHKENKPNIASRYCQWSNNCKGDGTRLNSEEVNDLRHEVRTLGGLDSETKSRASGDLSSGISYVQPDSERTREEKAEVGLQTDDVIIGHVYCVDDVGARICQRDSCLNEIVGVAESNCSCCYDWCNSKTNGEELDTTSLDDWACLGVTVAANAWYDNSSANVQNTKQTDKSRQTLHNRQHSNDSSDNCGYHAIPCNYDNGFHSVTTQKVENLCSLDQRMESPGFENLLTSDDHGNNLISVEARDGDEAKPQNSGM